MTLRVTFGIDPGLSGAVAVLADGDPVEVFDLPVMAAAAHNEVDAAKLGAWLRGQFHRHRGAYFCTGLERVRAMPAEGRRQGTQSSMNFGEGFGKVKAVLEVLGIPYTLVEPAGWKRRYGLAGQDKDAARVLALTRFPALADQLQRKKDGGRADALWIALFHDQRLILGNAS